MQTNTEKKIIFPEIIFIWKYFAMKNILQRNKRSLKKYVFDQNRVIAYESFQVQEDLSYKEVPVKILDRKEWVLRTKTIPRVKVLWRNHSTEEARWEAEEEMKQKYPYLFSEGMSPIFEDENFFKEGRM